MTEIVTDEGGDEAGDEISFTQLEYLGLHCLPNLKGFNLSNRTIRFPLLKYVTVTRCPELKMLSNGVLSTPKLKKVELAEDNEKLPEGYYLPINGKDIWEGDLNTTIVVVKKLKKGFSLELLNPNTCKVIRRKRNKEGGAGGDRVMVLGAMLIEVQTVLQT
uniref:Uncharacterized protein n=1 Tax=Fagus sylvatica TaxID=28930 RepID=A0A2N9G9V8_FAGSY